MSCHESRNRSPYHRAKCDQPNQRIRGQQRQAHDQGVLQRLQAILLLAGIHDVNKDGRGGSGTGKLVLDRRTHGV